MKFIYLASCLALVACTPVVESQAQTAASPTRTTSVKLPELSVADKVKLGKQIWKNESGGTVEGLTAWNKGEEFPSMGIGHFIWYPKGFNGRWTESFPKFIKYAQAQGRTDIPAWVLKSPDCPWNTKASFDAAKKGTHLTSLRTFLQNSVQLQTEYIISTSRAALPKILAAAPAKDRARIKANYAKVAQTANGTYALIDYVNFKGDGTNPTERYKGQGWGLLQVLSNMKSSQGGQASAKEFAESAKRMLLRRVKNSPPARGEKRWTAGWNNRCDTYAKPL